MEGAIFILAILGLGWSGFVYATARFRRSLVQQNARSLVISKRARISFGLGLAAFILPMILGTLGIAEFHDNPTFGSFPDESLAERICLFSHTMSIPWILVAVIIQARLRRSAYLGQRGQIGALIAGVIGAAVLMAWFYMMLTKPYSHESLYGWHPCALLGWTLLCWYFIYRK